MRFSADLDADPGVPHADAEEEAAVHSPMEADADADAGGYDIMESGLVDSSQAAVEEYVDLLLGSFQATGGQLPLGEVQTQPHPAMLNWAKLS